MRLLVDLREEQVDRLNRMSEARKVSRAELIRNAVDSLLSARGIGLDDTAGLWKGRGVNSERYQRNLREDWNR